tara:strand:+ start:288 stop:407 length:120 start_codon:yes stop_codon:yes gene_type:complete
MIKNTLLILLCSVILFSCGKKGDPEYKESKIIKSELVII